MNPYPEITVATCNQWADEALVYGLGIGAGTVLVLLVVLTLGQLLASLVTANRPKKEIPS